MKRISLRLVYVGPGRPIFKISPNKVQRALATEGPTAGLVVGRTAGRPAANWVTAIVQFRFGTEPSTEFKFFLD
jgi:hypothetical protein